ncbi:MAG: hypothetical protein ACKO24_03225 [Leptolyngbyaceae cyanobacterium]
MIRWIGLWSTALILSGCVQSQAPQPRASPNPPLAAASPGLPENRSNPKTLKLRLTLDSPADLKVREGDFVSKDQVLSVRASAQAALLSQKWQLESQLAQLRKRPDLARPVPSYSEAQAQMEVAHIKVEQAQQAITYFKATSPYTSLAWLTLPLVAERAKLKELESGLIQAQMELKLMVAHLQQAKDQHQQALYQDKIQQDTSLEQAQTLILLSEINKKLTTLGVVRSPYNGAVKKVKWLGQVNQELQIELTLAVQDISDKQDV